MASAPSLDPGGTDGEALHIALVNAMPDRALLETERQFAALVEQAAARAGLQARVTLYALDGVARSQPARALLAQRYGTLDALFDHSRVDGVIVTGAAPQADRLESEAFWPHLVRLFGWAEDHAGALLASCLAAHAAVAHFDGIARRRLPQKCCGVFDIEAVGHDRLLDGLPRGWRTPHSRYHTVDELALRSAGYTTLSRSDAAGLDAFARMCGGMLLVGLNGHPEYAPDTLLREYRRDVARAVGGHPAAYPELPHHVLGASSERALRLFRDRAARAGAADMAGFPGVLSIRRGVQAGMMAGRVPLFANWLAAVQQRRPRMPPIRRSPMVQQAMAAG